MCLVYDIYDDSANITTSAKVNPLSVAELTDVLVTKIEVAFKSLDADSVGSIVAAATATLNNVNCSQALTCKTAYKREDCSIVANTCGKCLKGYVGIDGYANSVCVVQSRKTRAYEEEKIRRNRKLLSDTRSFDSASSSTSTTTTSSTTTKKTTTQISNTSTSPSPFISSVLSHHTWPNSKDSSQRFISSLLSSAAASYYNTLSEWNYIDFSICKENSNCFSGKCFRGICQEGKKKYII